MDLTFTEACERLRVSHMTLTKLIHSGQLEAYKVGPHRTSPWRITEQAIAEYKKRQTEAVAAR
jgi:excisionase family DNA binding protein